MTSDHIVSVGCQMCNNVYDIKCNESDFNKWKNREGYIQDLLHYLSKQERELLVSGTCGTCFDELFSPEEDEDEDDS